MGGSAHAETGPLGDYTVYSGKVVGTAFINAFVLFGAVALFVLAVRYGVRRVSICYDVRRRLSSEAGDDDINRPPPSAVPQLRVFFLPGAYSSGLELLRIVGLDGVVAVRFAMMCAHFSVICTPLAAGLCLVYRYGPNGQGKQDLQSMQMSNQRGPFVQVVSVVAAWWITCTLMYLINLEWKHFFLLRLIYFTGEHLEDAAKKRRDYYQRTVFVQRVPGWIRTHSQLRRAFEDLFDDKVERAVLCSDASGLRRAVTSHERLVLDQEAFDTSGGGYRGLMNIMFRYGVGRLLGILLGGKRRSLQAAIEQDVGAAHLTSTEQDVNTAYLAFVEAVGEHDGEEAAQPQLERSRTERYMMRALRQHVERHNESPDLPGITMPRRMENLPPLHMRASHLFPSQEGKWWGGGPVRCFINCCDREFARMISAGYHPCKAIRRNLGYAFGAKGNKGRVGFVTFKSRAWQTAAVQMTLHQSSQETITRRAPFPGDIIWENLCIPEGQVRVRAFFSLFVMLLALIFWSFVAALIQAIANLQVMHQFLKAHFPKLIKGLDIEMLFRWGEKQPWWTALNGFLPALALTLLLVVLPPLIRAWHRLFEGMKTRSAIMESSVRVCFVFNLVTMYVTAFSGSFLHSGLLDSGNPVEVTFKVIQDAASKLDDVSGYIVCYIFTKLGVRMLVYLCRPYAVIPWLLYCLLGDLLARCGVVRWSPLHTAIPLLSRSPGSVEEVAKSFLLEPPCFDWIVTDLSIVLALCTMYGVMAPGLIVAAVPFFWVYAGMVRYNVMFVYTQTYDNGGELFFSLVNTTFSSLLLSLLLLQSYLFSISQNSGDWLSQIGFVVWHLAIPLLMIVVLLVWKFLHDRYHHACRALSLQLAKELDADLGAAARERVMEGAVYQDPAVSRARAISGDRRTGNEVWTRSIS